MCVPILQKDWNLTTHNQSDCMYTQVNITYKDSI